MNYLLKIDKSTYFWILCAVSILFAFANKYFLLTDQLYYSTLNEQFTAEQIQRMLAYQSASWKQFLGYAIIPLIIIIRVLYSSFCLYTGNLVNETHWSFKSLFNISLKADAIFCLNSICNFYYYAFIDNFKTLEDLSVNCASLLKIVGKENIPNWLVLAYNSINVFELFYIVLLVLLIHISFKLSYLKSTVFVVLTYVTGNYFYIVAMTFLYLSLS
jgi:hypothetical protein